MNHNRGWKWTTCVVILPSTSMTCFSPTYGHVCLSISYIEATFPDADELPAISKKIG